MGTEPAEAEEKSESYCEHCGGLVGDDGLALEADLEAEMPEATDETGQHESIEKLRANAFSDAVKRRRRAD